MHIASANLFVTVKLKQKRKRKEKHMKLNKNKNELVLNFTGLSGLARETFAQVIQAFLIELGFHWDGKPPIRQPLHTTAEGISLNHSEGGCPVSFRAIQPGGIQALRGSCGNTVEGVTVFDATSQLGEFLDAVEDLGPKSAQEAVTLITEHLENHLAELSKKRTAAGVAPQPAFTMPPGSNRS